MPRRRLAQIWIGLLAVNDRGAGRYEHQQKYDTQKSRSQKSLIFYSHQNKPDTPIPHHHKNAALLFPQLSSTRKRATLRSAQRQTRNNMKIILAYKNFAANRNISHIGL